jgi:hypothetical protein
MCHSCRRCRSLCAEALALELCCAMQQQQQQQHQQPLKVGGVGGHVARVQKMLQVQRLQHHLLLMMMMMRMRMMMMMMGRRRRRRRRRKLVQDLRVLSLECCSLQLCCHPLPGLC